MLQRDDALGPWRFSCDGDIQTGVARFVLYILRPRLLFPNSVHHRLRRADENTTRELIPTLFPNELNSRLKHMTNPTANGFLSTTSVGQAGNRKFILRPRSGCCFGRVCSRVWPARCCGCPRWIRPYLIAGLLLEPSVFDVNPARTITVSRPA